MIPVNPDKPFADYNDQICHLRNHNIVVNDPEYAKEILHSVSYYTLVNGYRDAFTASSSYPSPVRIEELYGLHMISVDLSTLLLKHVLLLEKSFKTKLSYEVASKYGVCTDLQDLQCSDSNDYLGYCHYSNSQNRRANILKQIKIESIKHPNASFCHYQSNKNHIPPWILVDNIPFGLSINWYSLLRPVDKEGICNQYFQHLSLSTMDRKELFKKSLDILKSYRNDLAHGGRVIGVSSKEELTVPQINLLSCSNITKKQISDGIGKNDITALILVLSSMSDNQYMFRNLFYGLHSLFDDYIEHNTTIAKKGILEIYRIPDNIFKILNDISKSRF